ncbi:hypothetical protein BC830DRAFT_1038517, partial [Chytriomyces sp. MP71]
DHDPMRCPLSDVCFACCRMGHTKDTCPNVSKRRFCEVCQNASHSIYTCPNHWRKYKLKSSLPQRSKNEAASVIPKLIMYCYNCGSNQHFGDECEE